MKGWWVSTTTKNVSGLLSIFVPSSKEQGELMVHIRDNVKDLFMSMVYQQSRVLIQEMLLCI